MSWLTRCTSSAPCRGAVISAAVSLSLQLAMMGFLDASLDCLPLALLLRCQLGQGQMVLGVSVMDKEKSTLWEIYLGFLPLA